VAEGRFKKTAKNLFVVKIGSHFNSVSEREIRSWLRLFKTQHPNEGIDYWQVKATHVAELNIITIILLLEIRTKPLRH